MDEIVKVDINCSVKTKLAKAINARFEERGISGVEQLDLGIDFGDVWPLGPDKPTLAELVVLAKALDMRVRITGIELLAVNPDRRKVREDELEKRYQRYQGMLLEKDGNE